MAKVSNSESASFVAVLDLYNVKDNDIILNVVTSVKHLWLLAQQPGLLSACEE